MATVFRAANQAAMLALGTAVVGDIAIRTDLSSSMTLTALPPATLGNWSANVASYNPPASTDTESNGPAQIIQTIAAAQAAATAASDAAGAAAAAQAAAIAASAQRASNLADLASAATARTNLGLGTAATQATTAFDAAGSAATETTRAQTAEALLAPKASPALTGTPTAPTATPLDNSTTLSTTAYADAATLVEKTRALAAQALLAPKVAAPTGVAATDTAVLQAAINAGGRWLLSPGTYVVTGLTGKSGYLFGAGVDSTFIKLANGANADVYQGFNFASLTLTGADPFGGSAMLDFGLSDLTIDGNRANQTGTSFGIRVYGANWFFNNLDVRNCYTDGIWTEGGPLVSDAPNTSDGSEASNINVKSHHNGRHGWLHLGPSDCRFINCMAFKNNQASGTVSVGFWGLQDQISNVLATAVGMNGVTASGFTGTFTVSAALGSGDTVPSNATDFYAASGSLAVTTSTGTATMTYTGKTASAFTGCTVTAGTGVFQTGNKVVTSASKFTTNGLQLTQLHSWSNDHTWAAVLDGQTSGGNNHFEGARYGQLLVRGATNLSGGFLYDFSGITTGLGLQLGDAGATLGIPLSAAITANACDIHTRVSAFLQDTPARSAVNWVACNQSKIEVLAVVKSTGTYTAAIAVASNGVDVSTFTSGSPGTITTTGLNNIPAGSGGSITVPTTNGNVVCTYTGTNGVAAAGRTSGTIFTGVVAATGTAGSSNMATGGTIALNNVGTVALTGTPDINSTYSVQSKGGLGGAAVGVSNLASSTSLLGVVTGQVGFFDPTTAIGTGESTFDRTLATASITPASQELTLTFFTAKKTQTIGHLYMQTAGTAAGATPTRCQYVLYTVDASQNLTQVAITANDTTMFAGTFAQYSRATLATYTMVPGQRYALGVLVVTAAAMPAFQAGPNNFVDRNPTANPPALCAKVTGQATVPASIAAGSLVTSTGMLYGVVLP